MERVIHNDPKKRENISVRFGSGYDLGQTAELAADIGKQRERERDESRK